MNQVEKVENDRIGRTGGLELRVSDAVRLKSRQVVVKVAGAAVVRALVVVVVILKPTTPKEVQ